LVELGKNKPLFGINRWKKNPLRFVPVDDESFTLCVDKKRLLYKGRRRSHRFTILNDGAFEYDCILLKEPESNVITLRMEGAELYDFFRQPDFVPDDFLKGSYAVYKKETLIGEGTGKLCHIHRPLIIDSRGRKVWGELAVIGNVLNITIPEWWLASAKYPVTVDPTIGTITVGKQTKGPDPNNSGYDRPWLDSEYTLNKFLVPENGESGICRAYVYTYYDDVSGGIKPLLYSNRNNNTPFQRMSKNEKIIDVTVWPQQGYYEGWRNNTFELNKNMTAGSYVWFGLFDGWFTTKYDYGGECYKTWFDEDDEDFDDYPPSIINIKSWDTFCNIKWSIYFTYTAITSQNYVRTLTQGINLTDTRTLKAEYNRNLSQTTQVMIHEI